MVPRYSLLFTYQKQQSHRARSPQERVPSGVWRTGEFWCCHVSLPEGIPTIPAPMSPYNVFLMSRKRCVYTKYSMYIYIYTYIYIYHISYQCIISINIYIYIWVTYNISLTWIKAILGWFPSRTMIIVRSQWGRSEVVIIYPYIYIYIYNL